MLLRKLTLSDYDEMLELYRQLDALHAQARPDLCVPREGREVFPREVLEQQLQDPRCLVLGAFDPEGTMAGTVLATLWEGDGVEGSWKYARLDDIYVLPGYRRRGVGRALFLAVEQWAGEQGALRLDLHVFSFNKSALALYEAMGMAPREQILEKFL